MLARIEYDIKKVGFNLIDLHNNTCVIIHTIERLNKYLTFCGQVMG